MTFDWISWFESNGIDHTVGPAKDVRTGHVGIACPVCASDTGTHFSIDVSSGKVRGCWRDKTHWMSGPKLMRALAGVPECEAWKLLQSGDASAVSFDAASLLDTLESKESERGQFVGEDWPREFHPLGSGPSTFRAPFRDYMESRGFPRHDHAALYQTYDISWCRTGRYKNRIIFPLFHKMMLVGWTGRAITRSRARYDTHPPGVAAGRIVWNNFAFEPKPRKRDVLVLCEGTFDALKLDWFGWEHGLRSSALLGNNAGSAKLRVVAEIAQRFRKTYVMLDRAAEGHALDIVAALSVCGVEYLELPGEADDPGEMTAQEVRALAATLMET